MIFLFIKKFRNLYLFYVIRFSQNESPNLSFMKDNNLVVRNGRKIFNQTELLNLNKFLNSIIFQQFCRLVTALGSALIHQSTN